MAVAVAWAAQHAPIFLGHRDTTIRCRSQGAVVAAIEALNLMLIAQAGRSVSPTGHGVFQLRWKERGASGGKLKESTRRRAPR